MRAEPDPRGDAPKMGQPGWLPDEDAIRRAEFAATTPGERVAEAISISRTATKIAAAAAAACSCGLALG